MKSTANIDMKVHINNADRYSVTNGLRELERDSYCSGELNTTTLLELERQVDTIIRILYQIVLIIDIYRDVSKYYTCRLEKG